MLPKLKCCLIKCIHAYSLNRIKFNSSRNVLIHDSLWGKSEKLKCVMMIAHPFNEVKQKTNSFACIEWTRGKKNGKLAKAAEHACSEMTHWQWFRIHWTKQQNFCIHFEKIIKKIAGGWHTSMEWISHFDLQFQTENSKSTV